MCTSSCAKREEVKTTKYNFVSIVLVQYILTKKLFHRGVDNKKNNFLLGGYCNHLTEVTIEYRSVYQ